jgi:four helix bundle protein
MRNDLDALEQRTKFFAITVIRFCLSLSRGTVIRFVGDQLARAAGSVAANHRAMRRSRSSREFAAKLQIVNEEIDESVLWLEIVDELLPHLRLQVKAVIAEGIELRSIFARARSTTRQRLSREQ